MINEKVLLALNGQLPSRDLILQLQTPDIFTICADGAWDKLTALKLKADCIAGDFDSVKEIPESARIIALPDQNASDLEKILNWLTAEKLTELTVIGLSGGRIDHFLTNVSLLIAFADKLQIRVYDDEYSAWLLTSGSMTIDSQPSQLFSLLPWMHCTGVSLKNAKFPLTNAVLQPGSRGLSNICTDKELEIHLDSGGLGLILQNSVSD